jgi:hypothetical protein
MSAMLRAELRSLLPAWFVCLLLPLPATVLWKAEDGRRLALGCFFVGCTAVVAYSFRRELSKDGVAPTLDEPALPQPPWRVKMLALALALLAELVLFSAFLLSFNDSHDVAALLVALTTLVPSLCLVPYLTLLTGKPYAAVVFTVFLVGCMKLLGGIVVRVVYGPYAVEEGHTTMPWTDPNLLVWVFWIATAILSAALYSSGYRRFQSMRRRRHMAGGSQF